MTPNWTDILYTAAIVAGTLGSGLAWVYRTLQRQIDEQQKRTQDHEEKISKVEAAEAVRSQTCSLVHTQISHALSNHDRSFDLLSSRLDELKTLIIERLPTSRSSQG